MTSLALGVALLSGPARGQDAVATRDPGSVGHGWYDLASRTFHLGERDTSSATVFATTPTDLYDNGASSGTHTTLGGEIDSKWVLDWGDADFGGGGAEITDFVIEYTSLVPGDDVVDLTIRLYQGSTGFGAPGTLLFEAFIPALPGKDGFGFPTNTWQITVSLSGSGVEFDMADGDIGWAFTFHVPDSGPSLVDLAAGTGTTDKLDVYLADASFTYDSTIDFGGSPYASTYIKLLGRAYPDPWSSAGPGLAGTGGVEPLLVGEGTLFEGSLATLTLSDSPPLGTTAMIIGFSTINLPFKGGLLVPSPDVMIFGLPINTSGIFVVSTTWPPGVPPGFSTVFQFWNVDPGGPVGFSASNAVAGTSH